MSMERRALLAFVASLVLFLAWDALYMSPRVKKQEAERRARMEQAAYADSVAAAERGDTVATQTQTSPGASSSGSMATAPADTAAMTSTELPTAEAIPSNEITVVNDVFEITFTSAGGEITEARLLHYDTDGQPVDLFPVNPDWTREHVLNLRLDSENAALGLGGVAFQAFANGSSTPLEDGARVTIDPRREYSDLVFRATTPEGQAIERTYRFYPDRYDFEASVRFARASFPAVTGITWGFGPGMQATEPNVSDDQMNFRASIQLGEEFHRLKANHFSGDTVENYSGTLSFASLQTKYFLTAIVPPEPTRADVVVTGDKAEHRLTQRVTLPAVSPQAEIDQTVRVYIGPLEFKTLESVKDAGLDKTIEMGWRWIRPVAWIVLKAMIWMHQFIPNYGWVIIIISVLTKVLFYRLTHKSFKSMKEMQDLQPRLAALKEKFGDDKQRLSQETMKLYKEAGVNPLGGCLPMVLQMPVFVALFNVLKYTIEVRGAHFVGWIGDLSQQDVLFTFPVTLPFIGNAFSLLPILMGVSMFLQSKLGGSPTGGPSATQPPGMTVMLPVVFTVLFYKMPSGLVIYWIINTVLSVAQQYYIHRDANNKKAIAESGA